MKYKITDEKWESIMDFFAKIFKHPEKLEELPEKSVVLSLLDEEITKIFTKERMRLIRCIREKNPKKISELAKFVERDLKILESFGIVKLVKTGKEVRPIVEKSVLVIPLIPRDMLPPLKDVGFLLQ